MSINSAFLQQGSPFDTVSAIDWFKFGLAQVFQPFPVEKNDSTFVTRTVGSFEVWNTVNVLCKSYSISDFIYVNGFLRSHFEVVPLLFSVIVHLEPLNLPYTPELKLVEDADNPESSVLFVTIPVNMDADDAMDLLEYIDEDWWLDLAANAEGRLVLDVRHI
ncbi:MAG: hypothetical protein ACYCYO_08045 [Bacilli bacterium]